MTYIEGATYGYKNNEMSDGRFNRSRFVCLGGVLHRLDATNKYVVGTFDIEKKERLVLIEE